MAFCFHFFPIYLDRMIYTLQHLLDFYKPILKHTDEKIILLFHLCMLNSGYSVIDGTVSNLIIILLK